MMNKPLRNLFAGLVALVAGASSLIADPAVGALAPDFVANDADGKVVKLSGYKGKVVVLEWYSPGCHFVKKFYESGKMQELQSKYAAKGVVWLSVVSNKKGNPEYLDGVGLRKNAVGLKAAPAAILQDASGDIARLYSAKTTPHMFVISADGKLAYKGAIDSIRSTNSADIAKATPYLANAVDAVLSGKTPEPVETKPYGCGVKL